MIVHVLLPLTMPIRILLSIRSDSTLLDWSNLNTFLAAVMLGFFGFVAFAVWPTPILNVFVHLMLQESAQITAQI